jgi:hypothetical protein
MNSGTYVLSDAQDDASYNTGRGQFLSQLRLRWDPFLQPVAEQELALSGDRLLSTPDSNDKTIPKARERFALSHFVTPDNPLMPGESLITALRQPASAFVFGEPGMGKTSLRFALEADCRRVPDGTLVVSYLFERGMESAVTAVNHWYLIGKQLAIDAIIQIIEQFKPGVDQPTQNQIQALGRLIRHGGRPSLRLIERILDEPEPEQLLGLGERWRSVNRLPVRYVSQSAELLNLLKQALNHYGEDQPALNFDEILVAIQEWSFSQTFILIDGVDTWWRNPEKMFALAQPLMAEQAGAALKHIYFKWFLPQDLRSPITQWLAKNSLLLPPLMITNLAWNKNALREILAARFQAAGSRRVSLADLAEETLADDLDDLLLTAAQGSPRRLLQLVSALIDIYVEAQMRHPEVPLFINFEQWQRAIQKVEREWPESQKSPINYPPPSPGPSKFAGAETTPPITMSAHTVTTLCL